MKKTFRELMLSCYNGQALDLQKMEDQAVHGHDVLEGPCCCGAWHTRKEYTMAKLKVKVIPSKGEGRYFSEVIPSKGEGRYFSEVDFGEVFLTNLDSRPFLRITSDNKEAQAVLRAIKAQWRVGRRPIAEWERLALAAGWNPPKGRK